MSNSYIPPHRRNGSSVDATNKYTTKDELLASLGIRQPNNVHFADRDFSIRVFSDEITAFPEAERLFMKDSDEFKLKKVLIGNETLQHYHLKNSFFDSADLSISYTDKESSGRLILQFGVSLEESDIGGSVSYRDLGLTNRASVGAFVSKFPEIALIPGLNNKLVYIINTIATTHRDDLMKAMKREIVEECTPNGEDPITVGPLSFVKTKAERNGKRLHVRYIFKGCESFKKVREMDVFPMIFYGTLTDIYYVYGTGNKEKDHKYLADAPYNIDEFDEDSRDHLITVEDLETVDKKSDKSEVTMSPVVNNYTMALSETSFNKLYNSNKLFSNESTVVENTTPKNEIILPPSNNLNTVSINKSNNISSRNIVPSRAVNIAFGYRPKTITFNRTARKTSKPRSRSTRKVSNM